MGVRHWGMLQMMMDRIHKENGFVAPPDPYDQAIIPVRYYNSPKPELVPRPSIHHPSLSHAHPQPQPQRKSVKLLTVLGTQYES